MWGKRRSVFAAMRPLEETVDVLESEAGAQGTFLNDLVMEEILGELQGHWPAGRHLLYLRMQEWKLKINYSFGGTVLRPVRRCAETPCGDHVGH